MSSNDSGVKYDDLTTFKTEFDSIIEHMMEIVEIAKDKVDKLDNNDAWSGSAYEDFRDKTSDLQINFDAFCTKLYELSKKAEKNRENFELTDKTLLNINE